MQDVTRRQITKIAREVSKFTVRMLRQSGVGAAEYDFLHVVRKNPGITQAGVCEVLSLDKGAAARRAANLEAKGYLVRTQNPADGRSRLLYATEKADSLKTSKASVEALYYAWLQQELTEGEKAELARLVGRLYARSKQESREDFVHLAALYRAGHGQEAEPGSAPKHEPTCGAAPKPHHEEGAAK